MVDEESMTSPYIKAGFDNANSDARHNSLSLLEAQSDSRCKN